MKEALWLILASLILKGLISWPTNEGANGLGTLQSVGIMRGLKAAPQLDATLSARAGSGKASGVDCLRLWGRPLHAAPSLAREELLRSASSSAMRLTSTLLPHRFGETQQNAMKINEASSPQTSV